MDMPNYSTWEKTDKKVFDEPHFGRTQSLNDYGKKTWGSSDGHGKYIAQHFNVFPDGKITTGRHLNSKPIGIRGILMLFVLRYMVILIRVKML